MTSVIRSGRLTACRHLASLWTMTGAGRARRVFICDDEAHEIVLLAHWLEDYPRYRLVGSAATVDDALGLAAALAPDIILTDTMQDPRDPTLLVRLRALTPGARLVIYSGYAREQLGHELVEAADAVVYKDCTESQLIATLDSLG